MIPVQLTVRNFMSYGEDVPPLDFTQFHTACLSGNNGHGKSALLDAIVWTVWGEARKGAGARKADEGLLRIGCGEMRTELVFDLEGDRYRAIRTYRKTKSGGTPTLEFQVYDPGAGAYVSLSEGGSVTKTQARINRTLRMDYNTFINSAFILQGRADEFTRKSARERKAILADVLGLGRYEDLSNLAKRHQQEADKECVGYEAVLADISEELSHKGEYEAGLADLESKLETVSGQAKDAEEKLGDLRALRTELLGKQREAASLNDQIAQNQADLRTVKQQIERQQEEVEAHKAVIAQEKSVQAAYRQWDQLRARDEGLAQRRDVLAGLEAERNELAQAIQSARHNISARKQAAEARLAQLEQSVKESEKLGSRAHDIDQGFKDLQQARNQYEQLQAQRAEVDQLAGRARDLEKAIDGAQRETRIQRETLARRKQELERKSQQQAQAQAALEAAQKRLTRLEALQEQMEHVRKEGTDLSADLAKIESEIAIHEAEIVQTQKALEVLETSPEARCPLCEAPLDSKGREHVQARHTAQIQERTGKIDDLGTRQRAAEEHREELRRRFKEHQKEIRTVGQVQAQVGALQKEYEELAAGGKEVAELSKRIAALDEQLEGKAIAAEQQQELERINQSIRAIGYDPQRLGEAQKALERLRHFEQEKGRLEAAEAHRQKALEAMPTLRQDIAHAAGELEGKQYAESEQARMADVTLQMESLAYNQEEHRQVRAKLQQLEQAPVQMERLRQAQEKLGPAVDSLRQLGQAAEGRKKRHQRLKQAQESLRQELEALPRIEEDVAAVEAQQRTVGQEREAILQKRGALQAKHDHCLELEKQQEELRKQLDSARKEQEVYDKLRVAFGKNGIQALIIENAIPELEDEANAILGQLTDYRTQVSIEPLRDLKGGGVKETLDIKISDEMGTRSYEMYSGGEAFRTDFALRIALSKLLAKRAGTKLRTLVVDEGFGTQDAQGLEHLVEAIQTIGPDFDKILVVTHLEQLKNAFPVQIEVTKYPQIGSRFEVRRVG